MGLQIKLKKLHENARLPERAYQDAIGFDLTAISKSVVEHSEYGYIEYGTGWAVEIPSGYAGKLYPRSSISKTGMILANHVGLIDPDYRGEILFRFKWIPGSKAYEVGEKIGQIVFVQIPEIDMLVVDELSSTSRGDGGFGSSGN